MLVSIIIRTYNEQKYLATLLESIYSQECKGYTFEIIIVDSGSTDGTLSICRKYDCLIANIKQEEFSFGRSLNIGCNVAKGKILVFISGHCIPVLPDWLNKLIQPIIDKRAVYTYGGQIGNKNTKFSEHQVFSKYYPNKSRIPQAGFFCNNANAALLKKQWQRVPFCEELTGLEDMHLAKKIVLNNKQHIAYIAEAKVYHIHEESWLQIKIRYERESIALQKIMPEIHINFIDFIIYYCSSVYHDLLKAQRQKVFLINIKEILTFRLMQYWGSYVGNHAHRKLSAILKKKYFYPRN